MLVFVNSPVPLDLFQKPSPYSSIVKSLSDKEKFLLGGFPPNNFLTEKIHNWQMYYDYVFSYRRSRNWFHFLLWQFWENQESCCNSQLLWEHYLSFSWGLKCVYQPIPLTTIFYFLLYPFTASTPKSPLQLLNQMITTYQSEQQELRKHRTHLKIWCIRIHVYNEI